MAVAYVKDAGLKVAANFSGTTNGSFASLPGVGNHVVVGVAEYNGGGVDSVTDNQGNNYGEDQEETGGGGSSSGNIYSCKVATSAGTFTITIDPGSASGVYAAWTAVEFSWLAFYAKLWSLFLYPVVGLHYLLRLVRGDRRGFVAFSAASLALHGAACALWRIELGTWTPFPERLSANYPVPPEQL